MPGQVDAEIGGSKDECHPSSVIPLGVETGSDELNGGDHGHIEEQMQSDAPPHKGRLETANKRPVDSSSVE